jgi:hypothetical protein
MVGGLLRVRGFGGDQSRGIGDEFHERERIAGEHAGRKSCA